MKACSDSGATFLLEPASFFSCMKLFWHETSFAETEFVDPDFDIVLVNISAWNSDLVDATSPVSYSVENGWSIQQEMSCDKSLEENEGKDSSCSSIPSFDINTEFYLNCFRTNFTYFPSHKTDLLPYEFIMVSPVEYWQGGCRPQLRWWRLSSWLEADSPAKAKFGIYARCQCVAGRRGSALGSRQLGREICTTAGDGLPLDPCPASPVSFTVIVLA